MPAPWLPGRPPNALDVERTLNGKVTFLGTIVSAGAAADNSSAASLGPTGVAGGFNFVPRQPAIVGGTPPQNLMNTLAGRTLLLQPTAAGSVLGMSLPIATAGQTVQGLTAATAATTPGPKIQAEERVPFIMGSGDGWLQFIPTVAAATSLFVWELT